MKCFSRTVARRICLPILLLMSGMVTSLIVVPTTAEAQDNTVGQLKELQELRKEVDRKKAELRRELRLLKDVLGEEPQDELMELSGGMTPDELARISTKHQFKEWPAALATSVNRK